jgi:hypothetical protein
MSTLMVVKSLGARASISGWMAASASADWTGASGFAGAGCFLFGMMILPDWVNGRVAKTPNRRSAPRPMIRNDAASSVIPRFETSDDWTTDVQVGLTIRS